MQSWTRSYAMSDFYRILGQRIRTARKRVGLKQQELAQQAGFSAHQIISQIEMGERVVKAWELATLAKILRVEVSDLLAIEEPESLPVVLWRQTPQEGTKIKEADFLKRCQQYGHLERLCGAVAPYEFPQKGFDSDAADFSGAERLAEKASHEFALGARPAAVLEKMLQDRHGVKVWYTDLGRDGSAASTFGSFGPAILMNSVEAPWRRNYNFAHEVFHLLTWKSVPVESLRDKPKLWEKIEKFANAFASHLLLPGDAVSVAFDQRVKDDKISFADLIEIAREFDVSTDALLYRLLNLRRLDKNTVESLRKSPVFRNIDRTTMPGRWWEPPAIPERFVRLAFMAYQKGRLSRARLAQYLDTSLMDLTNTLLEYGFDDREDYQADVRAA